MQCNERFEFKVDFPFSPLSQNNIEKTGYIGGAKGTKPIRYKTKEARKYRQDIEFFLTGSLEAREFRKAHRQNNKIALKIDLTFHIQHELCLTKKSSKNAIRRLSKRGGDTSNYIKYTEDCIFDWLGINDSQVYSINAKKIPSLEPSSFSVVVSFDQLDNIDYFRDFLSLIS